MGWFKGIGIGQSCIGICRAVSVSGAMAVSGYRLGQYRSIGISVLGQYRSIGISVVRTVSGYENIGWKNSIRVSEYRLDGQYRSNGISAGRTVTEYQREGQYRYRSASGYRRISDKKTTKRLNTQDKRLKVNTNNSIHLRYSQKDVKIGVCAIAAHGLGAHLRRTGT